MTYLPVKLRSELVSPMKSLGGGVCDSTFRFQVASPASNWPALSPMRESGLGGVGDMLPALDVEWAQPARAASPSRRDTERSDARAMTNSLRITRGGETGARRAFSASGRSRWFDPR